MSHLEQRIRDISKKYKLSHVGSCLSVLPILEEIYSNKAPEDLVILDNAHSHLAHLVIREQYEDLQDIERLLTDVGIHCDRKAGCDVSGGSLGHGIGIAIGLALGRMKRTIHVIVSDGSMMEGSNWEALRVRSSMGLTNIRIYCNFNGFSAVQEVDRKLLEFRMRQFIGDATYYWTDNGEGLEGLEGHYKVI